MLYIADVKIPVPQPEEVLVEVRAAGINPGETAIRSGALASRFPATFPSGEGSDLAGVVKAVASGFDDFEVGDEVLGWTWQRASHADYVAVPAAQLIPKPPQLTWAAAGSLYVVGATAWAAVRAIDPGDGEVVAVSAAAGGVGTLVVQLLRLRGARVLAIASKRNHDWLTAHGALPIGYGDGLAERLTAAAPGGIDAFIDLYGPEYVQLAIDLSVAPERIDSIASFEKAQEVGAKTDGSISGTSTEVLANLAELIASSQIEIPIAATYALEDVRQAFAELEQRHTHGKIVLIPGASSAQ